MDSRLLWLALAAFVGGTEGGLIVGLLPSVSDDMGVTLGAAGLLVSAPALGYAVGAPVLLVVLGRVGRRRILAGAELALALCALLMAISPFFPSLVATRTLLCVATSTFTGTAMAVAAAIAAPGQRGRAMQTITLGQSAAVLIGVPVGAFIATRLDWRIDYWIIAALAIAAATALYLKIPRGLLGDTQTMRDRVRVLNNPGVRPALLTTLLMMMGTNLPWIYVGAVVKDAQIGADLLAIVLLCNGVGGVAASMSFGRLSDHFGNRRVIMLAMIVQVCLLPVLIAVPHLPQVWRAPVLLAEFAVFGFFGWGYWIAHCSQMAHLAPTSVPVAISLDMAALNIAIALAAVVGGFIVDHWGVGVVPMVSIPLCLAAMVVWQSSREPAVMQPSPHAQAGG